MFIFCNVIEYTLYHSGCQRIIFFEIKSRSTDMYTWAFLGSGRAEKKPVEKLMARARPQPDPTARGPTR